MNMWAAFGLTAQSRQVPLVSDTWESLADKYNCSDKIPDSELYRLVVENLVDKCFLVNDYRPQIDAKLTQAIGLMHNNVRNITLKRKIKVVKEIASSIDYEIGQRYDERNLAFHAALIVIFYMERESVRKENLKFYETEEEFLGKYPATAEFPHDGMDSAEVRKLIVFSNFMKIILLFLNQATGHREHAILLAVRITEGKSVNYTFGGGASPATRRRIKIYQREGGVVPKKNERSAALIEQDQVIQHVNMKSQNLLDSIQKLDISPRLPSASVTVADPGNDRRNAVLVAADNDTECVSVWEQVSGDAVMRVSSAINQGGSGEGDEVTRVLGRSISLSFPQRSGSGAVTTIDAIADTIRKPDDGNEVASDSSFLLSVPKVLLTNILQDLDISIAELQRAFSRSNDGDSLVGGAGDDDDCDILGSGIRFVRESTIGSNGPIETLSISKLYPVEGLDVQRTKEMLLSSNISLQGIEASFLHIEANETEEGVVNEGGDSLFQGFESLPQFGDSGFRLNMSSFTSHSTHSNDSEAFQSHPCRNNSLYIPMQFEDSMVKSSSQIPPLTLSNYTEIFTSNVNFDSTSGKKRKHTSNE